MHTKFYVHRYTRHNAVTGSLFLYSVHWPDGKNVRFFVEAGLKQGEADIGSYNGYIPFDAGKMSFGIVTHNHVDHVGLLPVLVRQGFKGPIFTTYNTANLIDIPLYDSAVIEDKDLGSTICDVEEVEKTLSRIVGAVYKRRIKPHKNITITFFHNGHIVGAALTLIVITCPGEKEIVIVHSGDYKERNLFFNVPLPPVAVRGLEISNFVCEATYGNVDSNHPMFKKCLADNTAKALKNGMTVLYPTFSLGRHQEALYYLKMWKEQGIIPEETLIVIDGRSSQDYNARFMYTDIGILPNKRNFMPRDAFCITRSKDKKNQRRKIISDPRPKVILAPGGMLSYGPVTSYASKLIPRNDVLIHALGYSSPESTMYKLLNAKDGDTISYNGLSVIKRCQAMKTAEMSSHATRNELLRLIQNFPYTKSISINHGEIEVQDDFREYLLDRLKLPKDQITTADSQIGVRIESCGITNTFNTYFEPIY